jgi:hypothetical protein
MPSKNRDYKRVYALRKKHAALVPFGEIPHGYNGYVNYFCRCDECRAGWASYTAIAREKRTKKPFDQIPHGASGYANHKCRCDICKLEHNKQCKKWRDAKNAKKAATTPDP